MKFLFFFLLIGATIHASNDFFEKFYFDFYSELHNIVQLDNNDYIISGMEQQNDASYVKLIRTNDFGETIWIKSFPGIEAETYYRTDV